MLDQAGNLLISPVPNTFMPARRFAVSNPADCQLLLSNMDQFEGIRSQGIVVRNLLTGQRWKMRTINSRRLCMASCTCASSMRGMASISTMSTFAVQVWS